MLPLEKTHMASNYLTVHRPKTLAGLGEEKELVWGEESVGTTASAPCLSWGRGGGSHATSLGRAKAHERGWGTLAALWVDLGRRCDYASFGL